MAKKSRRARKRQSAKRQVARQVSSQAQAAPRQAAMPRASEAQAPSAGVNFAEEYAYVLTDLKRIAIIAAAMLVVLVALSFVIR